MTVATLSTNSNFSQGNELFAADIQDKVFSKVLIALLVIYFVFGVAVPFLERVEITREVKERIPPQLAKLILKEKQLPPPEKVKEQPKEEIKPEIEPEVKPEKPIEPVKTKRAIAKQKAASSGLAAMKDDLFAMRDAFVTPAKITALSKGNNEEVKIKRKLLASQANKQSQSLAVANVAKTIQSDELSSRSTQTILLAEEEVLASEGNAQGEDNSLDKGLNTRSEVTLRRTLESSKSRLYALYNRALRKDPFLKGKVLFEIEIQANGVVSKVVITSSQLNNKKLERQLTLVLKSIRFTNEEVSIMTTVWAVEFLPS